MPLFFINFRGPDLFVAMIKQILVKTENELFLHFELTAMLLWLNFYIFSNFWCLYLEH